ncbi:phenylalanine--tRNA ligase subunit beta [Patescibacteria group bacterium]|nr:phenylalanine--tRNA ligase subunit beta [Patescibacteria group bacterium]
MKISLAWIQNYFDTPLPKGRELADALTFHAFEIEEASETMLDVKVLPNRAADCLSHRGIARELSAILNIPIKSDPLRALLQKEEVRNSPIHIKIEDEKKCARYMGALIRGVKVGPSPAWLQEALEAVGQRSINNVVDATNYVMLDIGQPLHAFDAGKLTQKEGAYAINVRSAKDGEKITTLSGDEYTLAPSITIVTDANTGTPIALAGIKGGKAAELTNDTTDLIVESANFDAPTTRRAAQKLKLFTDASIRFQNRPSPELAAYGMREVLKLITDIAGGEAAGIIDEHPARAEEAHAVSVSLEHINAVLGADFSSAAIADVFKRLDLPSEQIGGVFTVTPPFERADLAIPEDLIEEVGRVIGYDALSPTELPPVADTPDQNRYRGIERMKDQLVEQGFIEVSTQSFAGTGDVTLFNPLDTAKPALRTSLEENLAEALAKAKYAAPLVLEPGQKPKLFEIGTVFLKEGEHLELRMTERVPEWGDEAATVDNLSAANLEEYGKGYEPKRYALGSFRPYSAYPFIVRDIAFWAAGAGQSEAAIEKLLRERAGELLVRLDRFDRFEKEGRVSLAYRLVFQSFDRTLTDEEINNVMNSVSSSLAELGCEVR